MERMETEDVKKVKNYMAFRSHSSNMDMTPRAKKIFEAAKTVKKQLYQKNKTLKRYVINETSSFEDIEICFKKCMLLKYKNVQSNINEEVHVAFIIDDEKQAAENLY